MQQERAGRIILVRHGETEANLRGCFAESNEITLTETGCEQARVVARRLAVEFRPTRLYSSSFRRARQTGEIIAQALGLINEILEGIHERDFGSLKGHPYRRMAELMSDDPAWDANRSWSWIPPGGESLEQVRQRAVAVIERVREAHRGEEVVIVCHGAVIQAVIAHLRGEWSEAAVPENCGLLVIEPVALGPK